MNAIIENPIKFLANDEKDLTLFTWFNLIIVGINKSDNEKQLREIFTYVNYNPILSKYFKVGFGAAHMWVKQIIDHKPQQQVLFVEF